MRSSARARDTDLKVKGVHADLIGRAVEESYSGVE